MFGGGKGRSLSVVGHAAWTPITTRPLAIRSSMYLNLYISGTISSLACLPVDGQSSKVIAYGVRLHIDSVARGVN